MMHFRLDNRFLASFQKLAIAGMMALSLLSCSPTAVDIGSGHADGASSALIDLRTTTLRDQWTEADRLRILANERLLAYFDAEILFFVEGDLSSVSPHFDRVLWDDWVAIIWERNVDRSDRAGATPHPRDLDLTIRAYDDLRLHVLNEMRTGAVPRDPSWRTKFPEIYYPERSRFRSRV